MQYDIFISHRAERRIMNAKHIVDNIYIYIISIFYAPSPDNILCYMIYISG